MKKLSDFYSKKLISNANDVDFKTLGDSIDKMMNREKIEESSEAYKKVTITDALLEEPIGDIYHDIAMLAIEKEDNFIFEKILPWSEEKTKMVLSKELLKEALLTFRREHPHRFLELSKKAWQQEVNDGTT